MEHLKPKIKPVHPEEQMNLFSKLCFMHTRHILVKGYQKEITEDDLYEVLPSFKSKKLGDLLESRWKKQVEKKKFSVTLLLCQCFKKEYLLLMMTLVIPMILTFFQQKFVKKFISCFTSNRHVVESDGYFYGSCLIIFEVVRVFYYENFLLFVQKLGLKIRASLTSLIYRKVLKLRNVDKTSTGNVITLITRDIYDFDLGLLEVSNTIRNSMTFLMICAVLYSEIGWLFLSLVAIILTTIFIDFYFALLVKKTKLKTLRKSDERYQMTKEVLSAGKLIKCYLWYEAFKEKICKIRKQEVRHISKVYFLLFTKLALAESILAGSWYILVVVLISFGIQSNAGTLFLLLNSVNFLANIIRYNIPATMHAVAKMITISRRIEMFLRRDFEDQADNQDLPPKITFSKINQNFEIYCGVTAITGNVGSGKTFLLKAIAEEQETENLRVSGSISYASQEPWLFPSTIKQNILFGSDYEPQRYSQVLQVCDLHHDLKEFQDGDDTIVADRGINLSKGQQARINLARAIYKNRDIYLLDDCLSNLDVLVADYIFEQCIKKILRDKIVIMVTQNQRHISGADNVITLRNGAIEFRKEKFPKNVESENLMNYIEYNEEFEEDYEDTESLIKKIEDEKKIYEEKKVLGRVKFDVYKKYFVASGSLGNFFVILFFFLTIQFVKRTINKLESKWIQSEQIIFSNTTNRTFYTGALEKRSQMLYTLPVLLITATFLLLLKVKVFWHLVGKASINLHKLLFEKVMNSSIEFFDSRFVGTILNRFSEDLFHADEIVPTALEYLIRYSIEVIGTIFLFGTASSTILIICAVYTMIVIYLRFLYLKTGRALKRLEFSTRSPVIGHINSTIEGLSTIRISKAEEILMKEFNRHLDLHNSASYISLCCEVTFDFFVDFSAAFVIGTVIFYLLLWNEDISLGNVGLMLSHIFKFAITEHFLFSQWTKLENNMTTVERILELTKQKQENKDGFVVKNWPSSGQMKFENVSFSYDHRRNVLENLNFIIESKEKVAIVGRTASGKTSFVSSILRLYKFQGKIYIDGVDITTLAVDFYRSRISIIFQDPILFTGTLRENIDPSGRFTDEEIWKCLEKVNLTTVFKSLDERISHTDSELSVGQKQLICLCRALVQKNKIVILDEVTANVDRETEELIHAVIFEQLKESTVIEITHKLGHILDYDKVIVFERGRICEFGDPSCLLGSRNGMLHKMCKKNK